MLWRTETSDGGLCRHPMQDACLCQRAAKRPSLCRDMPAAPSLVCTLFSTAVCSEGRSVCIWVLLSPLEAMAGALGLPECTFP